MQRKSTMDYSSRVSVHTILILIGLFGLLCVFDVLLYYHNFINTSDYESVLYPNEKKEFINQALFFIGVGIFLFGLVVINAYHLIKLCCTNKK